MARSWLPRSDVAVVAALVLATASLLFVPETPWPVEWALGVPFLVLFPGYAVVSALFPERPDPAPSTGSDPGGTPGWATRLALSFGLSGVVVATIGVVLSWTIGIRLEAVVFATGAVTLAGLLAATVRRGTRPDDRRADPLRGSVSSLRRAGLGSRLQTAALVVAAAVLLATVAYAGATQPPGERFSEFYLLTEGPEGNLVAANYTTTFVAGEGHPLHVAIENHEGRPVSYDVVVLAQSVRGDGTVVDEERIDSFGIRVRPGERVVVERLIAPTTREESLRLRFLLYKGSPPADPGAESADLSTHIWIDVVEA